MKLSLQKDDISNQWERDEIPKMIKGYMIKHEINKVEDFYFFSRIWGRKNIQNKVLLSVICKHLNCINKEKIKK